MSCVSYTVALILVQFLYKALYYIACGHYTIYIDFELWTRRFESYCRAAKVADGLKCDVLLAALDDDAFRAVDVLGLSDEVRTDYTQLMSALEGRFAPTTSQFELRFRLRRRIQQGESFDDFAGTLTRQGNRALPDLTPKARSEIIRDQFIEGLRDSYIQERLFQECPDTLDEAFKTARKLGAARSAQQSLNTTNVAEARAVNAVSDGFNLQ